MPKKTYGHRTSMWRKTVTLFLLPAIILLWMIGWILTQIGSACMSEDIRQKADITYPQFQANEDAEIAEDDEDSRIVYKPEIIA